MAKKTTRKARFTPEQKAAMFAQLAALVEAGGEYARPEYQRQSDDVEGYWVPEAGVPIHGILLGAKAFDSNIEPEKPTGLLLFELIEACPVLKDGEPVLAEVGDMVGVWAKPGMRTLKRAGGSKVWMRLEGEKEIGKPNPMKTFETLFERGKDIEILEDGRKESRAKAFWLTSTGQTTLTRREAVTGEFEDDGGF